MTAQGPVGAAGIVHATARDGATLAAVDAFVDRHPDATPFHRTAWNRAVAGACGQVAHWLVGRDAGGRVDAVLPLTEVHSPVFGRALVSVGFAVDGGVLAGSAGRAEALAAAAWALAERLSCPTVELRGGAMPMGWTRDETTYLGFARDLAADADGDLAAIPRKQRAEVRRSLDLPLTIATGRDAGMRAEHHAVYAESVHALGTPVFPAALFAGVLDAFGDDADILTVRHEGRAVASVLSLYHRGTVYPYWGGGTRAARALRANDRMYHALMGHARGRGCTRFDFGRSKAGTGAAAFKKNWGFAGRPLAHATRHAAGAAPRVINPLDPRNRLKVAAWQRLPLPIATRLGPFLSRGLG